VHLRFGADLAGVGATNPLLRLTLLHPWGIASSGFVGGDAAHKTPFDMPLLPRARGEGAGDEGAPQSSDLLMLSTDTPSIAKAIPITLLQAPVATTPGS